MKIKMNKNRIFARMCPKLNVCAPHLFAVQITYTIIHYFAKEYTIDTFVSTYSQKKKNLPALNALNQSK